MLELIEGPKEEEILSLCPINRFKMAKRISNNREDAFIQDCILDAWSFIDGLDGLVRRPVLPQTYRFRVAEFWPSGWVMPVPYVREITEFAYWNDSNVSTPMDTDDYFLVRHMDAAVSVLHYTAGVTLPTVYARHDAISVTFDAGYPDAQSVPRVYRRALQLIAAHFYDNREETYSDNRITQVPRRIELGASKILEKHRIGISYAGGFSGVSG